MGFWSQLNEQRDRLTKLLGGDPRPGGWPGNGAAAILLGAWGVRRHGLAPRGAVTAPALSDSALILW